MTTEYPTLAWGFVLLAAASGGCDRRRQRVVPEATSDAAPVTLEERLARMSPRRPPPTPLTAPASTPGDCQAAYAPRPDRDPSPMCKVPGGAFTIHGPGSPHEVALDDYYIDQFLVTLDQFLLFFEVHGNDCAPKDLATLGLPGTETCMNTFYRPGDPLSPFEAIPGGFSPPPGREKAAATASAEAARRYCRGGGKELPSTAQWEYAVAYDPKNPTGAVIGELPWEPKEYTAVLKPRRMRGKRDAPSHWGVLGTGGYMPTVWCEGASQAGGASSGCDLVYYFERDRLEAEHWTADRSSKVTFSGIRCARAAR